MVTVKISPDNKNDNLTGGGSFSKNNLRVEALAFAGLVLNEKASLQVEISGYTTGLVGDSFVGSIVQAEHSIVKVYLHNFKEVVFISNATQEGDQSQQVNTFLD